MTGYDRDRAAAELGYYPLSGEGAIEAEARGIAAAMVNRWLDAAGEQNGLGFSKADKHFAGEYLLGLGNDFGSGEAEHYARLEGVDTTGVAAKLKPLVNCTAYALFVATHGIEDYIDKIKAMKNIQWGRE